MLLPGIVASGQQQASAVNLINNPNFLSAASWNFVGGWSLGTNAADYNGTANGDLQQFDADLVAPMETNTAYTLKFDLTTSGTLNIAIWNANQGQGDLNYHPSTPYTQANDITVQFTTPSNVFDGGIDFFVAAFNSDAGNITNIRLTKD